MASRKPRPVWIWRWAFNGFTEEHVFDDEASAKTYRADRKRGNVVRYIPAPPKRKKRSKHGR
jgi:hypothetical protein